MSDRHEQLARAGHRHHGGTAYKHSWTDEEREIVRREYAGTNASASRIAAMLSRPGDHVTKWAVKGQVQKLGLARIKSRAWSSKEDEKLADLTTKFAPLTIARKLRRSEGSITNRQKRLGLSRLARDGWYTKKEVCSILGMDHKWVQVRIESGALVASSHHGRRPAKNGAGSWHIEQKALRHFIRTYPQELLGRNLDVIQVVEVLCGVNGKNGS